MKKSKKILVSICTVAACLSASVISVAAYALGGAKTPGKTFEYSETAPLRYKTCVSEEGSSEKGLLLYGYDNGATANFKGTFGGVFEARTKVVSDGGVAELRKYSLRFTDNDSGDVFSVEISNGSTSYCNVEKDGDRAGIVYYKDNKAYGYTAKYNEEGTYTFFDSAGAVKVKFDPTEKTISVCGDGEPYKTVWNFGEKYNDGKKFERELSAFDNYSVDIVFDEIKSAGKGELLVYSYGGFSFGKREIENSAKINVGIKTKAIVGQKYEVPAASVEDILEGKIAADVKLTVYDENGRAVNDGKYEFTPEKAGNYYAYYSYGDASEYRLIEAIDKNDVSFDFDYAAAFDIPAEIGLHAKAFIPSAKVICSLAVSSVPTDAVVEIYKDGKLDSDFPGCGGDYYSFDEYGTYKIVYSATQFGDLVRRETEVNVTETEAGIVFDGLSDVVEYGTTLKLNPTKVYVGGSEFTATSVIRYPSGKTANATNAVMDELGIYTLEETWDGGKREIEFAVKSTYSSLFLSSRAKFAELEYNNLYSGQMIELGETPLVYNKLINLSDNVFDDTLEDKSQNVPLVELAIQPSKAGQKDMSGLFIEFVDAHDSSNFISIRIKYQDYDKNKNRIRTKATGQTWVGYYYNYRNSGMEVHDAQSHDDGGFIGNGTFLQALNGMNFDMSVIRLYYDYEKCSLYSTPDHLTSEDNSVVPWLVRDYNTTDETMSAGQNPWRGFTNGEVYMRIYAAGISGTARVGIIGVDGDKFDGEYVDDEEGPSITVDFPDGGEIPFACVNKPYKIFDFSANDSYTGVNVSEPKVYLDKTEIKVSDGYFVPETAGVYRIVYKARDYYGNETSETIEVTAKNSLETLGLTFVTELPTSAEYGKKLTVPEVTAYGGAGAYDIKVSVTCNGDEIPLEYGHFRCNAEGKYLVKFTVTDYVGSTKTITKTLTVKRVSAPIIDDDAIQLPPEFFVYESYDLGSYVGYVYGESGQTEVKSVAEVFIDGQKVETTDGVFTPDETAVGKTALVRYTFKSTEGEESVYEFEVPIADPGIGYSGFMKNYFIAYGDAEPTCAAEGLTFGIPSGKDGKIAFARKIDSKHIKFYFKIGGARFAKGFDTFKVSLKDSVDQSVVVTLTIEKDSSVYWAKVGGKKAAFSVEPDGSFTVVYDYSTMSFVDVYEYTVGKVTECDNGKPFSGFVSGFVYATFELKGATENPLTLLQIANQNINDTSYDFIQPIITVNGYVSGNYSVGSTVTLPSATAYDVLSTCGKVKVSVTCGKDTILLNKDASVEQSFVIDKYGVYQIKYSVEADDMSGEIKVTRFVYCYDTVKPELKFNGEIPSKIKSGDTVKLPSYEISDNGDISKVSVTVYVCTPDGIMHKYSGNSVKLTGVGNYKIYYYVTDENENMNLYTFDLIAE